MDDFIMTIDSDTEDLPILPPTSKKNAKSKVVEEDKLDLDFVFDPAGDPYLDLTTGGVELQDLVKTGSKPEPISVDEIIARRRINSKRKRDEENIAEEDTDEDEDNEDEEDDLIEEADSGAEDDFGAEGIDEEDEEEDPLGSSEEEDDENEDDEEDEDLKDQGSDDEGDDSDASDSDEETQLEKARKAAFFDSEAGPAETHDSFLSMNLSRPILKAITTLGFTKPTPIQAATVPVALLGKDVVGNAVTGSGKTAAFIIPMLERLLYREKGKKAAATRCVVLVPTRELGVQCFDVGQKLAAHTDITFALLVGGLSLKSQEATLRTRPDIVIATPGRLIDHIRNSPSFNLDAVDVLVLDEADRMLSDGFADELAEIIKACPNSRQTMLFSATMTDSVDELVKMSLNKPVRLFVDPKRTTARGLTQEFVRVRKESERSAMLVALCKRTFKHKVIIFLRSKKLAHQMRIVFGLAGMRCDEMHGDLTQEQRLKALYNFKQGTVDYLMATDLASRGLDIKGVETVINYDMPNQLAQYLHRVGRTARAGKNGRSVTLVGEGDRKMLKAALKHSTTEDQIRHRTLPGEVLQQWVEKIAGYNSEITAIMEEEKEEKYLRRAEMELKKGQNLIEHESEIFSRPARTWFQTGKEKEKSQALSKQMHETSGKKSGAAKGTESEKPKRDKFAGLTRKAKRRKMAREEDEEFNDKSAVNSAIRSAKKASRPTKIGLPEPKKDLKSSKKKKSAKKVKLGNAFERDMSQKSGSREGIRAKKTDKVRLDKKVKNKGGKGKPKGKAR